MARAADFEPRTDGIETNGDTGNGSVDAFGSVGFDLGGSSGSSVGDAFNGEFDPDIHVSRDKRNADGSYTRKRGRKAGGNSAARSQGKKAPPSVNAIESALVGIHAMAAAFTKTPELILDDDESKPLAGAVAELAKHYDIPGLDAKAMAWVGLIMVSSRIYAPRFIMISGRLKTEAMERRKSKPTLAVDNTVNQSPEPDLFGGLPFDPLNPPNIN